MRKGRFLFTLTLITSIAIPGCYLIYYYLTEHVLYYGDFLKGALFTICVTLGIGSANMSAIKYLQKKYPWQHNNVRRILIELLVTSFNAAFIISIFLLLFYITFNTFLCRESTSTVFFSNIIIAFIVNTIAVSIYEGIYMFSQWKKAILESERLRSEKAESQYAALKNQVNPHFLFNSLNSLSSLIRISPEKAIDFVDKFSKIYRYVLDVNEKIVVELRDEMDFLQSFYFLHKIRFGENLEIIVEIESSYLSKLIPPLSLQILVENAIKHNEISGEHPLKIMIFVTAEYLVISNNLQLKKNMEGSTGIGLNNLTQRYEHLTEFKPKFYATHDEYIAMIPLLNE